MTLSARPAKTQAELGVALDLAASVFREGDALPGAVRHKSRLLTPTHAIEPYQCIVVHDNGMIIGTAFLVTRDFVFPDRVRQGTYLTSICMSSDARGQGVSRLLMETTLAHAQALGSEVALVVARRAVDHYYLQFGFHGVSQYARTEIQTLTGPQTSEVCDARLVRHGPAVGNGFSLPLGPLSELYAQTYHGQAGACLRDESVWHFIDWKMADRDCELHTLEDETAYAIHRGGDVFELGARDSEAYSRLLDALSRQTGAASLKLHSVSADHPVHRVLGERDHGVTKRQCSYGGHMICMLDDRTLDRISLCGRLGLSHSLGQDGGQSFNLLYMDES